MSSMSERKFCKNCVLLSERCRRLQYSLEKQRSESIITNRHKVINKATKKMAVTSEQETHVPRIQRSWVATTAYLQSWYIKGDAFFSRLIASLLHLRETSKALCTHTGAAASHHSGLPGCRIHCTGVAPDQDYTLMKKHTKKKSFRKSISEHSCLDCYSGSPVICSIDRGPGVTPVHLINVLLH